MPELTREEILAVPIQHRRGVMQFKCACGTVITFAENSQTYPMLLHRDSPGPGVIVGYCPVCGARHWKGTSHIL